MMLKSIKKFSMDILLRKGVAYVSSIPPKEKKAGIVILSKDTYFETQKSFPFAPMADIRGAVASDINAYVPFDSPLFFIKKIYESQGKTRVNLWVVKKDVARRVRKLSPVLILPETLVVALAQDRLPCLVNVTKEGDKEILVYADKTRAVKSVDTKGESSIRDSFVRTCDREAISLSQKISKEELTKLLKPAVLNMPMGQAGQFFNTEAYSLAQAGKTGLKYLYLGLFIFMVYTGISSWLIYQKKNQLEGLEISLSLEMGALEGKRADLESKVAQLQEIKAIVESYQPRTALLKTIMAAVPKGVLIRRIRISGHTVELEGAAPDASELMENLGKLKQVTGTRFTSPLRKDQKTGLDRFKLIAEYGT